MDLRQEIAIAFSKVPRPPDSALVACDCDECRWEVEGLRGKTWARLSPEDWGGGDRINIAILEPAALHYFLPGLMRLALDHPDELPMLPINIVSRLVVSDRARPDDVARAGRILRRLAPRQRRALAEFFRAPGVAEEINPVILGSVLANLMDGAVTPYSSAALDRWMVETYGGPSADGGRDES